MLNEWYDAMKHIGTVTVSRSTGRGSSKKGGVAWAPGLQVVSLAELMRIDARSCTSLIAIEEAE